MAKKDAPLAFRIPTELKAELVEIAKREARSLSQVCEILLSSGVDGYKKDGPRYLQHYLSRQKEKPTRK